MNYRQHSDLLDFDKVLEADNNEGKDELKHFVIGRNQRRGERFEMEY
jgi:hypothetical protein